MKLLLYYGLFIDGFSNFIAKYFGVIIFLIFTSVILTFFTICINNTNGYEYLAKIDMKNIPKEFNDLYEKIYKEDLIILNKLKKGIPIMKIIWWTTGAFTMLICYFLKLAIFKYPLLLLLTILSGIITIIFFSRDYDATKKYKNHYKENCLKKFIELLNKNYNYTTNVNTQINSNIRKVYKESECDDNIVDLIKIDDYIEGKINNVTYIELADIIAYLEDQTEKESTKVITFKGIFSYVDYKNYFNKKLKIEATKLKGSEMNKVQMDSSAFEKYFNVHCSDKILALRVINHNLMECLLNFYNKCNLKFEITFYKNYIAFRFFSGPMFEPKIFGKSLDKEILYSYYVILEFIENVVNEVNIAMKDFEV